MLSVNHTKCTSTGEVLDHALNTIEFYGFTPLEVLLKEHKPAQRVKQSATPTFALSAERKLAGVTKHLVCHGVAKDAIPHLAYQLDIGKQSATLGMHTIGSREAVAEGVLLATLATLLREEGIDDFAVHINSVGDRESSARFVRDLNTFLRNKINDMPTYARDEMTSGNPVRAFVRLAERQHELIEDAPNAMEYLNDESRTHLRSVLEYLEHTNVPYELNRTVLGSPECWRHTVFDVRVPTDSGDITIAHGGRHNALAQKAFRTDLPVVSALIEHEVHGRCKPKRRTRMHPKFFYAQLGAHARLQSFTILEQLRRAGIPVAQMLAVDTIGLQLQEAERRAFPYTLIVGHKEALEQSVIVRNMRSRSQVVVPVANLPGYLKRLKVS